jgi:Phosphoglycerate dehydrogenase and related dehydrogenases
MLTAVLFGWPDKLSQAYPPPLREHLRKIVHLSEREFCPASYGGHLGTLRSTEVILGTWDLPRMDEGFLEALPRLKAVFYAAGTIKPFATDAAFDRGIVFSSAWTANAIPVAEYTTGAILLSLRRFWQYARQTRNSGRWDQDLPIPGCQSKVGLISLGAVGRRVAQALRRYEVEVIAYDPLLTGPAADSLGVRPASLPELFQICDVVSIHTPWLPKTEKMINAGLLRLMKPGATLINTSRGAVVDQDDLYDFLVQRPDVTAILDVLHPEPPSPDLPLLSLPNVMVTPHIAGSMGPEIGRMGQLMCEELASYIGGSPLNHRITREMLSHMA